MTTNRDFLIDGNRRRVAFVGSPESFTPEPELAFAYAVASPPSGWVSLEASPFLERPLKLAGFPLFAPFGGKAREDVREIFVDEPRISRLWGRFSIDLAVALERNEKLFKQRIVPGLHAEGERRPGDYRVLIVEDGERYAIRGMCIFHVSGDLGYIDEILHDRTVKGMRAASHVTGLALRAMAKDGARVARAAALPHSGTMPILVRHAFRRIAGPPVIVRPVDEALHDLATFADAWYVSGLDFFEATRPA